MISSLVVHLTTLTQSIIKMKKTLSLVAVVAALSFISCKREKEQSKEETTTSESTDLFEPAKCVYALDTLQTTVQWTAFKTSAKIGVGGQFDAVSVINQDSISNSVAELLDGLAFSIETNSANTKNPDRDMKIKKSFFGSMVTPEQITGTISSAEGKDAAGTCIAMLSLNGHKKEVALNYTLEDNKINLTGEIDVNEFGAEGPLAKLNEVCTDLHKGDDGKSILWPNVDLNISIPISADCK